MQMQTWGAQAVPMEVRVYERLTEPFNHLQDLAQEAMACVVGLLSRRANNAAWPDAKSALPPSIRTGPGGLPVRAGDRGLMGEASPLHRALRERVIDMTPCHCQTHAVRL